jgi:triacylglycerol lipase
MQLVRQVVEPVGRVATALSRRGTYVGHAREAASAAITAGMWPFGIMSESIHATVADANGHPGAAGRDEHARDSGGDDAAGHDTPVLMVHGFGANRSNWTFLARHLRAGGFHRLHAINYNPLSTDLPHLGEVVARQVEEIRTRWGTDRVHVIGHSLGGVIARYAVQVLGAEGVDRCITVASPHGGVRVAGLHQVLSGLRPFATGHQLNPDSPFMVLLRSSARPMDARFVAYYSNLDLIVPARRAMILEPELGASNRHLKDQGHFSILLCRALGASVLEELTLAEAAAGSGSGTLPRRRPVGPALPTGLPNTPARFPTGPATIAAPLAAAG